MVSFKLLHELAYEGNIGIEELMMFYQMATDHEKSPLDHFLVDENVQEALALIELVTGIALHVGEEEEDIQEEL